jgi:hypothetical protein
MNSSVLAVPNAQVMKAFERALSQLTKDQNTKDSALVFYLKKETGNFLVLSYSFENDTFIVQHRRNVYRIQRSDVYNFMLDIFNTFHISRVDYVENNKAFLLYEYVEPNASQYEMFGEVKQMSKRLGQIESSLKEIATSKIGQNYDLEELKNVLKQDKDQLSVLQKQLEAEKQSIAEEKSRNEKQIEEAERKVAECERNSARMETQVEQLNERLVEEERQRNGYIADLQKLQSGNAELLARLESLQTDYNNFQQQVKDQVNENLQKRQEVEQNAMEKQDQLKAALDELTSLRSQLLENKDAYGNELKQVGKEKKKLEEELTANAQEYKKSIKELNKEKQSLQSQLQSASQLFEKEKQDIERKLEEIENQKVQSNQQLAELQNKLNKNAEAMAELQSQMQDREDRNRVLQEQLTALQQERDALQTKYENEVARLTKELSDMKNTHSSILSEYEAKMQALQQKFNEQLQSSEEISRSEMKKMKEAFQEEKIKLQQEAETALQEAINAKQTNIESLQNDKLELEAENNRLQSEIERVKQELTTQLDEMTKQLKNLQNRANELESVLQPLQTECSTCLEKYRKGEKLGKGCKYMLKHLQCYSSLLKETLLNADELYGIQNLPEDVEQDETCARNKGVLEEIVEKLQCDITEGSGACLQRIETLLEKNKEITEIAFNEEACLDQRAKLRVARNIINRKLEIIKTLNKLIHSSDQNSTFNKLDETRKNNIEEEFNKISEKIRKYDELLQQSEFKKDMQVDSESCKKSGVIFKSWEQEKKEFDKQDVALTNLYEDLSGAVRVYIRIKPLTNKKQTVQSVEKDVSIQCPGKQIQTFYNFYGVFTDDMSNKAVYTGNKESKNIKELKVEQTELPDTTESTHPGLYNTFKQVEDGYSIVVFGYGLSGSGKTFSLLGNKENPGILHYGLANLKNVKNIKVRNMFELYPNMTLIKTPENMKANLINLYGTLPLEATNETTSFQSPVNLQDFKVTDIQSLTDTLTTYRQDKQRIKATPNNPESSRSHLFIVFEITFESGTKGYVTIIDSAGRESPKDIQKIFMPGSSLGLQTALLMQPKTFAKSFQTKLIQEYKNKGEIVLSILKEGIFINETINHLIYYFKTKNNLKPQVSMQDKKLENYDPSAFFINPTNEMKSSKISSEKNCLMIPILKFLDSLSGRGKPTKFITLVCVRQEEVYCDQILSSLQFANDVKSS